MTFDNSSELVKIAKLCPEADLYLRIAANDATSTVPLVSKYGASLNSAGALLELAKRLDLNVGGVAFHVGSGAECTEGYVTATRHSRTVMEKARAIGHHIHTLDIGGGFSKENFVDMVPDIKTALHDASLRDRSLRIIAEP